MQSHTHTQVCDEEGGRFPQLLSAIEFCLLVTAGFGINVEEVGSLCECGRGSSGPVGQGY